MDFMKNFDKHSKAILETWNAPDEHYEKEQLSNALNSLKNMNPIELSQMIESDNFQAYSLLLLAVMYEGKLHESKLHKLDFSFVYFSGLEGEFNCSSRG